MSIGDTERATQDRVVSFFKDRDILDYEYVGNLKDAANKNIREDRLRAYLRLSGYSQKLIDGAVSELVKAADDMTHGLYDANHKVYSLLKYGAKVKETADGAPKTVYFMDVETPTNNDFAIAEEVTVVGRQEKRPDLELYFGKAKKEDNKKAFDAVILHKDAIENSLGVKLIWNRGDDIKSSKISYQINNVSIENETDWLQMAKFHAHWSKKFYDVIVPYLR